jgi:hypothetical protein
MRWKGFDRNCWSFGIYNISPHIFHHGLSKMLSLLSLIQDQMAVPVLSMPKWKSNPIRLPSFPNLDWAKISSNRLGRRLAPSEQNQRQSQYQCQRRKCREARSPPGEWPGPDHGTLGRMDEWKSEYGTGQEEWQKEDISHKKLIGVQIINGQMLPPQSPTS